MADSTNGNGGRDDKGRFAPGHGETRETRLRTRGKPEGNPVENGTNGNGRDAKGKFAPSHGAYKNGHGSASTHGWNNGEITVANGETNVRRWPRHGRESKRTITEIDERV